MTQIRRIIADKAKSWLEVPALPREDADSRVVIYYHEDHEGLEDITVLAS